MDPAMMKQLLGAQQAQKEQGPPDSPAKIAALNSLKTISEYTGTVVKYGAIPFVLWYGLNLEMPVQPGQPAMPPISILSLFPFL